MTLKEKKEWPIEHYEYDYAKLDNKNRLPGREIMLIKCCLRVRQRPGNTLQDFIFPAFICTQTALESSADFGQFRIWAGQNLRHCTSHRGALSHTFYKNPS